MSPNRLNGYPDSGFSRDFAPLPSANRTTEIVVSAVRLRVSTCAPWPRARSAHWPRAGGTCVRFLKLLRADSGFWNTKIFQRLEKAGWQYSIGVRMIKTVRAAVEAIDEDAWQAIEDYPTKGRRRSPRPSTATGG
jgi:hypothetical protein